MNAAIHMYLGWAPQSFVIYNFRAPLTGAEHLNFHHNELQASSVADNSTALTIPLLCKVDKTVKTVPA